MTPNRPPDSIARELVLQYLYCRETWSGRDKSFESFVQDFPTAERASEKAGRIASGVIEHLDEIDRTIGSAANNWPVHRMSMVCRSVLRIAAYELIFRPEVPFRVVIDEAVELAKRYETDETGAFVNGVLDNIASHTRPAEKKGLPQTS